MLHLLNLNNFKICFIDKRILINYKSTSIKKEAKIFLDTSQMILEEELENY